MASAKTRLGACAVLVAILTALFSFPPAACAMQARVSHACCKHHRVPPPCADLGLSTREAEVTPPARAAGSLSIAPALRSAARILTPHVEVFALRNAASPSSGRSLLASLAVLRV